MPLYFKPLWRLFSPLLLLLVSIYAVFDLGRITVQYQPLLVYLPYPILFIALLLAQQFNRLRLFATACLFLSSYWLIQYGLQQSLSEPIAYFLYTSLGILLPINICVLALLPERGIWGLYGLAVFMILVFQGLFLFWAPLDLWSLAPEHQYLLALKPSLNYLLSYGATAVFAICSLVIVVTLFYRNSEAEACLLICLCALYLTFVLFSQAYISAVLLSCCGFCLIYCLFRSSHDMAFRDELTRLRNRRAFNEKLRSLGRRYVIATLDVDHFKKFNDTHGHEVGDDVLKLVAAHIDKVGGGGVAYRYGGEEFCVVFRGASIDGCIPYLEQLRVAIASYKMVLRNQQSRPASNKIGSGQRGVRNKPKTVSVTISIGAAERTADLHSADEVLKGSDQALYKAKKQGRNCVVSV